MALSVDQLTTVTRVLEWAWEIGVRREGEYTIYEYELDGIHYDIFYADRIGTWTTPSGEVRPCIQATPLIVKLEQRKL